MNTNQALAIHETVRGSHTGEMNFPQVVARLSEIGVERYHADYCRQEKTFYLADGQSLVVAVPWQAAPIAQDFSALAVGAAIRQSQRGEHTYLDFLQKTAAAGCVGYFVQISGRRALYFGRDGQSHIEVFPTPTAD